MTKFYIEGAAEEEKRVAVSLDVHEGEARLLLGGTVILSITPQGTLSRRVVSVFTAKQMGIQLNPAGVILIDVV